MPYIRRMNTNTGIRFLRYSIGAMFVLHGLAKVFGGIETIRYVGGMPPFVPQIPTLQLALGLVATALEIVGGLGLITGFKLRYSAGLLSVILLAATSYHMTQVSSFSTLMTNTWPLELFFVTAALFIISSDKEQKQS